MQIKDEIRSRLTALGAALPENAGAALISSEVNRRYYTGMKTTDGLVIVTRKAAYALADFRYFELMSEAVGDIINVVPFSGSMAAKAREIIDAEYCRGLVFEDRSMSVSVRDAFAKSFGAQTALIPAGDLFVTLRAVKSAYELDCIKKAQKLTDDAFSHILRMISTDVTENEIALELEYHMRKHGAQAPSFDFICVSGAKSSMPHGQPSDIRLGKGFFTMDFGCFFDGYASDMTRTVCIGKADAEMRRVYDTVLKAQNAAIGFAKAGITGAEVDAVARGIINGAGYEGCFGHGLGHGVGLEIHESPVFSPSGKTIMRAGSVVTVEPGIYLSGKYGVRIEDMVILGINGCEDITASDRSLIEI